MQHDFDARQAIVQKGKLVAKKAGRPLEDADITTACQSACPTSAISFGDTNNHESNVSQYWVKTQLEEGAHGEEVEHGEDPAAAGHGEKAKGNNPNNEVKRPYDDRAFMVIEEIHTLPSISYLTKVRNRKEGEA